MATLTPILTSTPGAPPSYNVGLAETFSWVPIENDADRPLYARATYLTNASDIQLQLSADNINVALDQIELNTDNLEELVDQTNTLLDSLTSSNVKVPGFNIPPYDEIALSYVGTTDFFDTVTYLNGSTAVASLSFVYVTNPPTNADSRILKIKKI